MTLQEILSRKGREVYTIGPEATLDDVVQKLVACNCGSLVVCHEGSQNMLGIITERDILRACATGHAPLSRVRVGDCMSRELTTGSLGDEVETVMGLMTRLRIRHLPVVENGQLAGMISIGDVVKSQYDLLQMENHYLKEYLHS